MALIDVCEFEGLPDLGYARVSSAEQSENSHALEQQINRLIAAGCHQIYSEVVSGYKVDAPRPELDRVLAIVRDNQCRSLAVTRLDRLSRRGTTGLAILGDFADPKAPGLRVLDEPIDLTTAAGRLMAGQLLLFAEFHSGQKSESVRHGWAAMRKRRAVTQPPFGYAIDEDNRLIVDDAPALCTVEDGATWSRAEIARFLCEQYLELRSIDKTIATLSQSFGIWKPAGQKKGLKKQSGLEVRGLIGFSPAGFVSWLKNPALKGDLVYKRKSANPEIYYGNHEPLISAAMWGDIQAQIAANAAGRGFGSTRAIYPLSGLMYCGACGGSCYACSGATNFYTAKKTGVPATMIHYYQCNRWKSRRCDQRTMIQMHVIEAAVIAAIVDAAIAAAARVAGTISNTETPQDPEILRLETELEFYRRAPGTRSAGIIAELENQIAGRRRAVEGVDAESVDRAALLQAFGDPEFWRSGLTQEQRRAAFHGLVRRVTMKDGQVIAIDLLC